jgi:hypothetical protein
LLNDARVDPSVDDHYAIVCASDHEDDSTLEVLIRDPRVPCFVANQYEVVLAFDDETSKVVEVVFLNDQRCIRRLDSRLCSSQRLVSVDHSRSILAACAEGDAELIQKADLTQLGIRHLDILWARSRRHPEIQEHLRSYLLSLLPKSLLEDQNLMPYLDYLSSIPILILVGHVGMYLRINLLLKQSAISWFPLELRVTIATFTLSLISKESS